MSNLFHVLGRKTDNLSCQYRSEKIIICLYITEYMTHKYIKGEKQTLHLFIINENYFKMIRRVCFWEKNREFDM